MEYQILEGEIFVSDTDKNLGIRFPYKKAKVHSYILILTNRTTLELYMLYYKLTNRDDFYKDQIVLQNPGQYKYTLIYLYSKDKNDIYTPECVYNTLQDYYTSGGLKYLSKSVLNKHLDDILYVCEKLNQLYI